MLDSDSELDLQPIQHAADLLLQGELVAFPTETVYGLGADARNPAAVARIFEAKGRPADHPLIVHLPDAESMTLWAREIPPLAWKLAEHCWPGPLTLILPRQAWVPSILTGGQDTVGLRVPSHPVALALLKTMAGLSPGAALAGPSANLFGRVSPTRAEHVRAELGDRVAMVLDGGACQVGIESTIVDLSRQGMAVLRPGHYSAAYLAALAGTRAEPEGGEAQVAPRVSGSLASHYAPRTPVRLVESSLLLAVLQQHASLRCGLVVLEEAPAHPAAAACLRLGTEPEPYARGLYDALRQMDQKGLDLLLLEAPPATLPWEAVWDRLRRAAHRDA